MPYRYDLTTTAFSIGGFVAQNTSVAFEYIKAEEEYSPAAYSAAFDTTFTQTQIITKHLMPIGNGKMVNIEGTIGTGLRIPSFS